MEGEDRGRQQVVVMHRATFLATLTGDGGPRATSIRALVRHNASANGSTAFFWGGVVLSLFKPHISPHLQDRVLFKAAFKLSSSFFSLRGSSHARTHVHSH